jgi:hypothetical protein
MTSLPATRLYRLAADFDGRAKMETGANSLVIVANGIPPM